MSAPTMGRRVVFEEFGDVANTDLHGLLLMIGATDWEPCDGCGATITSGWSGHTKDATPVVGRPDPAYEPPCHVEGVGLFCGRACWERYVARQVAP